MKLIGKIPLKSVWMLLAYASDFLSTLSEPIKEAVLEGDYDADFMDPVARVLVEEVERRLKRQQLSFHYRTRVADLTRVRGRVDHLRTAAHRLMDKGQIACRFSELSVDSPRNRFIAAALLKARLCLLNDDLKRRCASAAFQMHRLGVSPNEPSRAELSKDRLGHHDASDRQMLDAAHLITQMAVAAHDDGTLALPKLFDDKFRTYGDLFETAVRNYLKEKHRRSWKVDNPHLKWRDADGDEAMLDILPGMKTDIVLDELRTNRRIVIEVKFSDALYSRTDVERTSIDSSYLYQLYAYVMSQTGRDDERADHAEGVLLFPVALDREPTDESVDIQGHRIRFLSVDLTAEPKSIRDRWDLCLS